MATEIEHKFLLINNEWKKNIHKSSKFKQGYMVSDKQRSVRIRTSEDKAWLNIKSATIGTSRSEYEYEIPLKDGLEILDTLCERPTIEKTRHLVTHKQHTWEIDVFEGDNHGLIIAEIELSEVGEKFELPSWAGKDVSLEKKYYNNSLCRNPYKNWQINM